jgi:preprotein translocase SecE subunit
MDLGIYKKGQGWYTRVNSAIALGLVVLLGAHWLAFDVFANARLFGMEPVYTRAIVFLVISMIFGAVGYHLIGRKQNVVDFMIAVEGEMKKVNWSSRKEIMGSTYIVISMTVFIALCCFILDLVFQWLSIQAGVLDYID